MAWTSDTYRCAARIIQGDNTFEVACEYEVVSDGTFKRWRGNYSAAPSGGEPVPGEATLVDVETDKRAEIVITDAPAGAGAGWFSGRTTPPALSD